MTDAMDVSARDLPDELRNFAEYARAVAADSVGPHRLTWQERAEWADACAAAAQGAMEALRDHQRALREAESAIQELDDAEAVDEIVASSTGRGHDRAA